ncbi:unnamed protein product [Caenorhabditis angaria]|uniref:Domain of unknown function DX domain-containing protein n=1 Tax=Caenorhabditis angaria TaxID=860376 RepID=A0A9P1IJ77_9PELO|nr:unnamed protein product [Caenorhabditis angaria]
MHSGCKYDPKSKSFEYRDCKNVRFESWFCPIVAPDLVRKPFIMYTYFENGRPKECESNSECPINHFCHAAYNQAYEGRDQSGPNGTALKYCFEWYDYIDYFYPDPKPCDVDNDCFEGECVPFLSSQIIDDSGKERQGICRYKVWYYKKWDHVERCPENAGLTSNPVTKCNTTSQCYGDNYDLNNRLYKWCDIKIGECCQENIEKPEEITMCPDGQTPLYSQNQCEESEEFCSSTDFSNGKCFKGHCCPKSGYLPNGKFSISKKDDFRTNVECDSKIKLAPRMEYSFCKHGFVWSMSENMKTTGINCTLNMDCETNQVCANLKFGEESKCFANPEAGKMVQVLEYAFKLVLDIVKNMEF